MMLTVIKKELRSYFNSAIAVIFLAVFLAAVLIGFFVVQKFFARGLADLRPLFRAMPLLLIILVSALSMRQWADERRAGTLEVLLTLPVPRWQLVVGKFLAAMVLIAIALALTLGLPITVAKMGNLDVGPVIGGYLATLLLSAAYLAIGMCVSAATNNEIVAFIGTAAVCVVSYAVGYLGTVGRLFGTGERFESVARGVLDLRDLAYYAGIVAVGIALNVLLLDRLTWSRGPRGRNRRVAAVLGVALVAANAVGLDIWLAPVRRARIDLTQGGTYSLSDSTQKILAGLDEPLLIRGYLSDKTHPRIAPLLPQLRDLLEEYRIAGRGKVRVEMIDPSASDDAPVDSDAAKRAAEAKREAKEKFGIDSTPFRFASQSERSVINAYFAIAIEYGDQHAVVGFDDLVTVRALDMGEFEITLKNPEYQLTRTIKKTVAEFSSVDQLFASTTGKVQLTAYVTPASLPEGLKDGPDKLKKVIDELSKQAGGKLAYTTVEPKTDAEMRDLRARFGIEPYLTLQSGRVQPFYFHLLLQVGDRMVRITPPQTLGDAELKTAVTDGLKRAAPGFTRVVGLWSPPAGPPQPPMQGMPPQEMPPPQQFRNLQRALSGNYEVRDVQLTAPVPDDVDALILAGPASLDAKAVETVDQFVMRGGALVVLAGRFRLAPGMGGGLAVEKVTTGLEAAFQKWGITVVDEMVMDTKNDQLPIPDSAGSREIHLRPYPFFVKMDGGQLSSSSIITGGLAGSVMHWASPVKAEAKVGGDEHRVDVLLRSSDAAWLTTSTDVMPNLVTHPDLGFAGAKDAAADKRGSQVMGVAIIGGFASSVAKSKDELKDAKDAPATQLLEHSPPDARIVVFGSSAFLSDDLLGLAQQLDSDFAKSNLELVHNAVDWSLADTDLLDIRSRNEATRALTVGLDSRGAWRNANFAIAVLGLALVVGFAWLRRRGVQPVIVREA
jgi:ABC-2 type transport system permease protein